MTADSLKAMLRDLELVQRQQAAGALLLITVLDALAAQDQAAADAQRTAKAARRRPRKRGRRA